MQEELYGQLLVEVHRLDMQRVLLSMVMMHALTEMMNRVVVEE